MAWIETRKATATKFLDPASHRPLRLPVKVRPVSLYQQELFLKQQRNQILKRGVRLPYLKILNVRLGATPGIGSAKRTQQSRKEPFVDRYRTRYLMMKSSLIRCFYPQGKRVFC